MSPPDVNSANCPICKGSQWTYETQDEQLVPTRCRCLERKLLLDFLGPEIARAKKIESELYRPTTNEAGEVDGDRTQENLFLKGAWSKVCGHLRWVLSAKRLYTPGFTYRIISDADLLDVWLGHRGYKQKASGVRDEVETHNALNDLLADATLIILRLGIRITKNRAAATVLQEALGIRQFLYKPTWVVEGELPFGEGHPAYSDDVATYIETHFDIVDLGGDVKAERALKTLNLGSDVFEEGSLAMDGDAPRPEATEVIPETKERFFATSEPEARRGGYKPGRRGKWRGNSGSGEGGVGGVGEF